MPVCRAEHEILPYGERFSRLNKEPSQGNGYDGNDE